MQDCNNLCLLRDGQSGCVSAVAGTGAMRRRLLDLGLIPGTKVTCQGHSPAGDCAAYLIRGAVIALRAQDAQGICLSPEGRASCAAAAEPAPCAPRGLEA